MKRKKFVRFFFFFHLCAFLVFDAHSVATYRHCHCCCMRNSLSLFDLAAMLLLLSLPETHDPTYTSTNLQYSHCFFFSSFRVVLSSPPPPPSFAVSFVILLYFTLYIFFFFILLALLLLYPHIFRIIERDRENVFIFFYGCFLNTKHLHFKHSNTLFITLSYFLDKMRVCVVLCVPLLCAWGADEFSGKS